VRADRHAGVDQFGHLVAAEPARFAQAAGQYEELGGQSALQQAGESDLDV
jgi:hypothetical protein